MVFFNNHGQLTAASVLLPLLLLMLMVCGCASSPPDAEDAVMPSHVVVPIAYATNRNIKDSKDARRRYGGHWSAPSYGVASVALSTKAKPGSQHADWTRWPAMQGELKKDRQLLQVDPLYKEKFYEHLGASTTNAPERSVLVYIHGYAQTFKNTAIAAALLAYRLDFQGAMMLYSWPSSGSPFAYGQDVSNVHRSANQLRSLLVDLATDSRFDRVHIVAHSLGNQGLIKALSGLLDSGAEQPSHGWKLGHIALVAPDLDAERFRMETAPWLGGAGRGVTLYVSRFDIPLLASGFVNQGRRVGDATAGALIEQGIDTVDSTPATNPFAAHLVHLHNPEIVSDLHYLFNEQMAAAERPNLLAVNGVDGRYWQARSTLAAASDQQLLSAGRFAPVPGCNRPEKIVSCN